MQVPNSHLPSGRLRGWLLATGEEVWKSAAKSGLVSKWHGIWTHCLNIDVGSAACNGASGGRSQLCDIKSDKVGSCSHLTARPRSMRVSHGTSNNAHGASDKGAVWSVVVGEATGGCFISLSMFCPLMPELNSSRLSMMRIYWSLKAAIASRTPYIFCSVACSAATGWKLAQYSSTRLIGMAQAGFNSTNNTSLPASCHWCKGFTNVWPNPSPTWCAVPKLAAQPGTRLSAAFNTLVRRDPSYIVLVDLGAPWCLPRSPFVAEGFWAVILSWAAWKRSWVDMWSQLKQEWPWTEVLPPQA